MEKIALACLLVFLLFAATGTGAIAPAAGDDAAMRPAVRSNPGPAPLGDLLPGWNLPHALRASSPVPASSPAAKAVAPTAGPTGGIVHCLTIDPLSPETIYAGTSSAGLFKTTNGGQLWASANSGFTGILVLQSLAIHPQTPGTMYAGLYEYGVYKSTNAGQTWVEANSGLDNTFVNVVSVKPSAPATLFTGTSGGLYRSTDSGQSWAPVNNGLSSSNVATLLHTSAAIYAGTGAGVFKSTDNGQNWTALNAVFNESVRTLAVDPQAAATLFAGTKSEGAFKSTDGGQTWSNILPYTTTSESINSLVLPAQSPGVLYAGTGGDGVFKSTDGGTTWNQVNTGLTDLSVNSLAVHPLSPLTLYAGVSGGGVFKSTDGGGTWQVINTGLTAHTISCLAEDPKAPANLYAGTFSSGIFKSTDAGVTWTDKTSGPMLESRMVKCVALDPVTPANVFTGTFGGGVFKSTDGGGSWAAVNTGLADSNSKMIGGLAVDGANPAIVYAATLGGWYKSTDAGANWSVMNSGSGGGLSLGIAIDPVTSTRVYAAAWSGVYSINPCPGCTPPSIVTQPLSKTVWTGGSGGLTVVGSGTAPLTFQWYEGASGDITTPLSGKTASSLSVSTSYPGTKNYWVRVTNACGSIDSLTATVTINCDPTIIVSQPQNVSIVSGQTAVLSVIATGSSLSYQWYQGISGYDSVYMNNGSKRVFTTPPLTATTTYWVSVTNSCRGVSSDTVTVSVCEPASVATPPQSQTILTGQAASLSVVAGGTAPFTYQWYQGASGVTTTPISGATAAGYTTPPLTANTSYWVKVTNACGSVNSPAAAITVTNCQPPAITTAGQPQGRVICTGQTAPLAVTVTGTAPIAYQWYQGAAGVTTTPISGATAAGYTTPALTATTSYWVKATNACGSASSATATITVCPAAPAISTQPASQALLTGRTVRLTTVSSGTNLAYQWYEGTSGTTSKPISGATGNAYTTPALTVSTNYWVKVSNACGGANSTTATITVFHLSIPAAAHTAGAGGTFWLSDVDLWNYGASDAAVRIALFKKDLANLNPVTQLVTVPAGKTLQLADVLGSGSFLYSNAGLGFATQSTTLLVNSRFYNTASALGGTYGMYIPAMAADQTLKGDGASRGIFHLLRYSPNSAVGYRTNIGFLNASGFNVIVEIRLYDDNGAQLGNPKTQTLLPFEHRQFTKIHELVGVSPVPLVNQGAAIIRVLTSGGEVFAYAMVIDNRSGDPFYMPPDIR